MAAAELPEEIITNILVRLPVNTLLQFRCVCKSWRSLINDPYFIKKHVNHVNMENEYQKTMILKYSNIHGGNSFRSLDFIHNGGKDNKLKLSFKDLNFPDEFRAASMLIKCCSDGIVCFLSCHDESLLLWNPSIREHKTLPPPPRLKDDWHWNALNAVYGIGYDSSIDDYKVFRVNCSVDVFAMKASSWKRIKATVPYEFWQRTTNATTFTNGRIHWMAKDISTRELVIAYIDVVSETFGKLSLPHTNILEDEDIPIEFLQLFNGNLCVAQFRGKSSSHSKHHCLWVMKEYGIKESWTKLLATPNLRQSLLGKSEFLSPFSVSRSGLLLHNKYNRTELVLYDPRDETFKVFSSPRLNTAYKIPYVESLVSPNRR